MARAKDRAKAKRRYWKDPETRRAIIGAQKLKYKYALTQESRLALLQNQDFLCAICKKPIQIPSSTFSHSDAHIDHDHKTGRVRGMLCPPCNTALGAFNDSVEILQSAIQYLCQ